MRQRDQWLIMPDKAEAASSTCVGTFPLTSPSRLSIDHRRLTRGTPTPSPSSMSNCSSSTCPKSPSATILPPSIPQTSPHYSQQSPDHAPTPTLAAPVTHTNPQQNEQPTNRYADT